MTDSELKKNIKEWQGKMPPGVELVAVSKFHPASMILAAYEAGQRLFGESRVQELLEKQKSLPEDIQWHFIGHLQTNKVKQLIGKTAMIESVDSPRLLELINKESEKAGVVTNVLLQAHVAAEETKFGFYPDELSDYLKNTDLAAFQNVRICGLMGMASNTDDMARVRADFQMLYNLYEKIKTEYSAALSNFSMLSMGMSGDWRIAVEEGSNIVRIGSAIFGDRIY